MSDLDAERIHVQGPSRFILLCGGEIGSLSSDSIILSLRHAFKKILEIKAIKTNDIIEAEDITKRFSFLDIYDDLLDFETDLAQIVELIILFCESEGSLAELGAFCMIEEIASRIFVVVREEHWKADSFIKLGPLRSIERKQGRDSICVLEDEPLGIKGQPISKIDKDALKAQLEGALEARLSRKGEPSNFDGSRAGHVIKVIVALIQEYGALTLQEICDLLVLFNIMREKKQIEGYLLCATVVEWVVVKSKGSRDFYIAKKESDTATIPTKSEAKERNKGRRRLFIRQHWQKNDAPRFRGIVEVHGGTAHE